MYDNENNSRKWRDISFFLILLVIVNVGFFANTYFDLRSQFSSLQDQFQENQREIQRLQQQIEVITYINQSNYLPIPKVFDIIKDSVVRIKTQVQTTLGFEDYAQGSGFVYDHEGHILTNNHVIEDADKTIVTFTSGNITEATIVGADPYSDIAVIKVDLPSETLHPVVLGNSSNLIIGEPVVAIGNPFGLSDTITAGIVSQVERSLSAPGGYRVVDVIQLDAAINPGNSGGPLVNMIGEVVGMNTAIIEGSSGVGFAIPSETITRELPSLLATGKYVHSWLGISGNDINLDLAEAIELNYTYGVLIGEIVEGGPADIAGLMGGDRTETIGGNLYIVGGDVIVGINGLKVRNFDDLSVYLERNTRPGDTINLIIIRNHQKITKQVILGERPVP